MRYTEDSFGESYKATIGTNIALKNVELTVDKKDVKAQIVLWDLAGQPTYADLRLRYMVGSSMAFIVYDVTRPETFLNVYEWYRNFRKSCSNAPVIIVANKIDRHDRVVPPEGGEMLKNWLEVMHIETSAKDGTNVEKMFTKVTRASIRREMKKRAQA
jgi:small GTP-binding protein